MRGTWLSGGFYACEGVDTSQIALLQALRNFGGTPAMQARFGGPGRCSAVTSQTQLFSREEDPRAERLGRGARLQK